MNQQGQLRVHITGKDCWAHEWSHNQVATSFDLPPNTIRKCKNPSTKKNRNLDECAVNHESFPPFPRNYFFLSGGCSSSMIISDPPLDDWRALRHSGLDPPGRTQPSSRASLPGRSSRELGGIPKRRKFFNSQKSDWVDQMCWMHMNM